MRLGKVSPPENFLVRHFPETFFPYAPFLFFPKIPDYFSGQCLSRFGIFPHFRRNPTFSYGLAHASLFIFFAHPDYSPNARKNI